MNNNDRVANWIINKIETEYANDVALLVAYGSYVNGTAGARSDIDCYFIPETERAYELSLDFIIDGVGYDIYPMSWERVEGLSELGESLLPCLGDAMILYARSDADKARFGKLAENLRKNLADDVKSRGAAEARLGIAGAILKSLMSQENFCAARKQAAHVAMFCSEASALYNHEYFHRGLKTQLADMRAMKGVPSVICDEYENLTRLAGIPELRACALSLYEAACALVGVSAELPEDGYPDDERNREAVTDWEQIQYGYEELSSTFGKVYACAENGNAVLQFISGACLQRQLDEICDEQNLDRFDMFSSYDRENLSALADRVKAVEDEFVGMILERRALRSYPTFEKFEEAKL